MENNTVKESENSCIFEEAVKNYHSATLNVIPEAGHGFDGDDSKNAMEKSVGFVETCEGI